MTRARTLLCATYYAIAIAALIATQRQNIAFMKELGVGYADGFAAFWPALLVNRPATSITVDIFLFSLAAMIWMALEARRLQIRFVWLYVLFGILVAISVTFPLFLVARERRLAALRAPAGATDTEPRLGFGDLLGTAVLGLGTLAFVTYCTLR